MLYTSRINYFTFCTKLLPFLIGIILCFILFVIDLISEKADRDSLFVLTIFISTSILLLFLCILYLRRKYFRLEISNESLKMIYLSGETRLFKWTDILSYNDSHEYSKQVSFAEVIFYLKNGNRLKISEEHVRDFSSLCEVLKKAPVKYAGYVEQGLFN